MQKTIRVFSALLGFAILLAIPGAASAENLLAFDAAAISAIPGKTTPNNLIVRSFLRPGADIVSVHVSLPANANIAPHPHPAGKVAIVAVLSGDFKVGLGDKFDEASLKTIVPGGIIVFRDTDPKHFARTGNGPVELLLVAAPKGSVAPVWLGDK